MKLVELKSALIQQFFASRESTVEVPISDIIAALGKQLQENTSFFIDAHDPVRSHEPSKAFARFASADRAVLLIEEEEPYKRAVIFGALRSGRKVAVFNLTDDRGAQSGSLGQVREALHQAKVLNDDICFSIFNEEQELWEIKR